MSNCGISECFIKNVIDFRDSQNKNEFIRNFTSEFGLSNITYFFVSSGAIKSPESALITTYSTEWQKHYFEMNYDETDPIVLAGKNNFLPLDWAKITKETKSTKRFFGEAAEFGVAEHGVTIPVRGACGETALVSLNSDLAPSDWSGHLRNNISDFTYFSLLLHHEALRSMVCPTEIIPTKLTKRETEVIQWAALGKTTWETSRILSLSNRTIEYYIRKAISKLGAVTKAQAVSIAIHRGLII